MRTFEKGWTALLAALVLSACSEATGPEPAAEERLNADVAMVAAQATIDDVADMWVTRDLLGAPGPPAGHAGDGLPSEHPDRRGDLTRSRTVTLYDGDGNEMDGYDRLLTATVVTVLDVSASREGPRWSAVMERHREMTLSGLEGEETERTWNGTGTDAVSRTRFDDEAGDRSYMMDASVTVSDVVVGVPRDEHRWPLSGTITRRVEVTIVNGPNGDETLERTVTITFDGTRYATLVVDGETYEVDLADRAGHRPRRRPGG